MPESDTPNTRLRFEFPEPINDMVAETMWALDLGDSRYQLQNNPFYIYSISYNDIVSASVLEEGDLPTFDRVVTKSGNRTIRVFYPEGSKTETGTIVPEQLSDMGCNYERGTEYYLSVNIPPNIDLMEIRNYLISIEADWEHADPTYEELFADGE